LKPPQTRLLPLAMRRGCETSAFGDLIHSDRTL
jgi:hypothetical protein